MNSTLQRAHISIDVWTRIFAIDKRARRRTLTSPPRNRAETVCVLRVGHHETQPEQNT